jgi:protein-disulfide isomerase
MFDGLGERFPGQILVLTYDFPLGAECNEVSVISHTAACAAAVAMRYVRIRGRGAAFEEWLWNNQESLTRKSILMAAMNFGGQAGLPELYDDLLEEVKADAFRAARIGVTGTPMYLVNGVLFGFVPRQNFEAVVLHELTRVSRESIH